MRYKKAVNANIEISELTAGTWATGGEQWGDVQDSESIAAIRTMIDAGVNLVDTAPVYGSGHSEEIVGQALSEGYREKVFLSTKFGIVGQKNGPPLNDGSYDNVIADCERSLKRLNTDFIDIYFMHWPDPSTPIEESMRAVNDLKTAGKVRFAGVSNFDKALIEAAREITKVDFLQPPYSMVNEKDKALLSWCEQQGIATMSYGSLGAGILTGRFRAKPSFPPDDFRLVFYDYFVEPKFSKIMELLGALDPIAAKYGRPLSQLVLNWTTQKSYVSTAIVGVSKPKHAEENIAAFEWSLSEDDMNLIDSAVDALGR